MPKKKKVDDLYAILEVSSDASDVDLKVAFHRLARKFHPDHHPGDKKAEEKFKDISEAYDVLSDPVKRAHYDRTGSPHPAVIASRKHEYSLGPLMFQGDIADIYSATQHPNTRVAFKVGRNPSTNDLLENEWKMLTQVRPVGTKEEKFLRYIPNPLESFVLDDGKRRRVNIFEYLENYASIQEVHDECPDLRFEHPVWMFNRILEALGFLHQEKKVVHGGILPSNVLVYTGSKEKDPNNHGARLVGWSYATPIDTKIKALSAPYEKFYPPEVLAGKPATAATDIYMAARTVAYLLGATDDLRFPKSVPSYLANFLRGCMVRMQAARPQSAWELHQEFKEHMKEYYGPKKYIPFGLSVTK